MNSPARHIENRRPQPLRLAATLALAGLLAPVNSGTAATVEVSNVPVSIGTAPKPNIMFILDDSGSMALDYMPDDIDDTSYASTVPSKDRATLPSDRLGYWSSHCNGVAFNPEFEYPLPVKITNVSGVVSRTTYPNISLSSAPPDGFNPTIGTAVNLSSNYYYTYTGAEPHLNWTYSSSGNVDKTTTFFKECMSGTPYKTTPAAAPGATVFTKVLVSSLTAAQQQQYANWYSYYRTRQLTMRSAAGLVFDKMTDSSRIGFTTISEAGVTQNTKFLDIADFSLTQKYDFFTRLYVDKAGGTPLRASLAKVGRYYGNHFTGQKDPIQYSCQRNFAILSTDGYWNTTGEGTSYGPFLLGANTNVGQQDGSEARPMKDSATGGTGSSNSLSDVAEYYWANDLRPDLTNNVAPLASDPANYQHLNTYTIGMGLRGTLNYSPDYLTTPANSDYAALISGTKNWPIPSGTLAGGNENASHIDDLWHAAVNGRGQYFSVGNSVELTSALVTALDNINDRTATGSAAAISAQAPVQTDRWIFIANYTSPAWSGDVRAFQFTINADGSLSVPDTTPGKESWSAAKKLDTRNFSTSPRTIYFNSGGATPALTPFTYPNLQTAGLSGSFDNRCALAGQTPTRTTSERLSQCATMSSAAQTNVNGTNLVDYLRGSRANETSAATSTNRLYRKRNSLLGDIINASPVYVGKPPFLYADAGYSSFASAKAGRTKVVYAAANDGMLHAFRVEDATGNPSGDELWAYVPTAVIPDLWSLADDAYKSRHRYYVDATPTLADVYDGSAWHTILVGGFGAGGRGYYALDVTTPESPKLLWEFNGSGDDAVGLSFGMPIVTKNSKGTWVVTLASGVNNVSPGDGIGRVYVLNALTGAVISTTKTCDSGACKGDTTTPSNLVHLNAWTISPYDNTTLRYYGGDMLGNMWRFDPDSSLGSAGGGPVLLLGQALSPDGKVQPISTKPILTEIRPDNRKVALVSFGTGRMLNLGDVADTTVQSIYTVRDALNNKSLGSLRSALTALKLNASTRLLSASQTINWSDASVNGWFFDLDATASAGERTIINGVSVHGVLGIASMKPTSDICQGGGSSYLYLIDLGSGTVISADASNEMITGLGVVVNSGGDAVLATTASGGLQTKIAPPPTSSYSISMKRTAWRELVD
ncbi:MAG: hypothetical protein RJA44_2344 [Pseudomonadota bacterium]